MSNEMSLALVSNPATFHCPCRELLQIVAPLAVSQCFETSEMFTTADARMEERSVPMLTLGATSDIEKLPVKIELTPNFFSIACRASMSRPASQGSEPMAGWSAAACPTYWTTRSSSLRRGAV